MEPRRHPPLPCPDAATLRAFRQGRLPPDLTRETHDHAISCEQCMLWLEGRPAQALPTQMHFAKPPRSSSELHRGSTIGRYVVLNRIGSGGMGVVYAAFDPELDRKVAIKLLQSSSAEGQAWLLREAQAMARLSHPNVISIFDVGTFGERVFIAMEYVEGETLRDWLQTCPAPSLVLEVFVEAGRGLAAAHAAGIVHRDFKPDNVLLDRNGRVRVMDFGLARASADMTRETHLSEDEAPAVNLRTRLTRADILVGTPIYMAPEQHLHNPADARTDQFSFAVSLYEVLYGEMPFEGAPETREELSRWTVKAQARKRGIPTRVRRAVLRGLSPRAEDRYPSLTSFLDDLRGDPGPGRMPYLWAAAVFAVAGVFFVGTRIKAEQVQLCQGADKALRGTWDEGRRQEVQAAFLATHSPLAASTWSRVSERLDQYAHDWVAMRTESCVATRVRGDQSDELMSLRMVCLDRRLSEMQALTAVLSTADATLVANSVKAVHALPELDACADTVALKGGVKPPTDPVTQAKVESVRRKLDQARVLNDTGRVPEALGAVRPLVLEAQSLNYRPLEAEALVLQGDLQRIMEPTRAEATLREAVFAAQASRDEETAVQAAILLIRLAADVSKPDSAHFWTGFAGSLLEHLEGHRSLRAEWLNAVSLARWSEGHYSEALGSLDQALELQQSTKSPNELTLARTFAFKGIMLDALGRTREAREEHLRALHLREQLMGPASIDVASVLNNIASSYLDEEAWELAVPYNQRALAILEKNLGADNFRTRNSRMSIAQVQLGLGRVDAALPVFQQLLAAYERDYGPDNKLVSDPLTQLGQAYLQAGHPLRAAQSFQRALQIREAALGPNHPDVAVALTNLARAKLALARPGEALPLLERALALQPEGDSSPAKLGNTRFALAQSLWLLRRDRPRALALAKTARASFAVGQRLQMVTTVDGWVQAHDRT